MLGLSELDSGAVLVVVLGTRLFRSFPISPVDRISCFVVLMKHGANLRAVEFQPMHKNAHSN